MVNANDDLSKLESIVGLEADVDFDKGANFFLGILAINIKQDCSQKKKEKQANQTNVAKYTKLPNEIFDYIHIAWCQRLFFLAWYNDLTYAQSEDISSTKELSMLYCNGLSCNFTKPNYIHKVLFINTTTPTITEMD